MASPHLFLYSQSVFGSTALGFWLKGCVVVAIGWITAGKGNDRRLTGGCSLSWFLQRISILLCSCCQYSTFCNPRTFLRLPLMAALYTDHQSECCLSVCLAPHTTLFPVKGEHHRAFNCDLWHISGNADINKVYFCLNSCELYEYIEHLKLTP